MMWPRTKRNHRLEGDPNARGDLSPIAASALALVMVGAIVVHVRRKENPTVNVVLLLLAVASAALGFAALVG